MLTCFFFASSSKDDIELNINHIYTIFINNFKSKNTHEGSLRPVFLVLPI